MNLSHLDLSNVIPLTPTKCRHPTGYSEVQTKSLQERLAMTENYLGQLCTVLSSYTRKVAKTRDKGDLLSKTLVNYSSHEHMNPCLKKAMFEFAENMSALQDYRQAEVQRLEAKVVHPLSNYGLLCKQAKNEVKAALTAKEKELNQRKKLDKTRSKNPRDREIISQAETELQKASLDASRSSKALEQQLEKFEHRKLEDLKKVLTEFVNVEMLFHAKALEVYTRSFSSLALMDPEADLEEFRSRFHPHLGLDRMSITRSASNTSLNGNQNGFQETPPQVARQFHSQPPTPQKVILPSETPPKQASKRPLPPRPAPPQSLPARGGEVKMAQVAEEDDDSDEYEDDDDDDDDDNDDDDDDDDDDEEDESNLEEIPAAKPAGQRIVVQSKVVSSSRR